MEILVIVLVDIIESQNFARSNVNDPASTIFIIEIFDSFILNLLKIQIPEFSAFTYGSSIMLLQLDADIRLLF